MIFNLLSIDLVKQLIGIQLVFIAFLIFSIFGHRLALKIVVSFRTKIREHYTTIILHALKTSSPFSQIDMLKFKVHKQLLVLSLEKIIKDNPKISLKFLEKTLYFPILQKFGDKRLNSRIWERRNWAARALQIFPDAAQEAQVLKLLDDSSFLNQKTGAELAVHNLFPKALEKILYKLHDLHIYGRYYYLNLFSHAEKKVIEMVKEIGKEKNEMEILASTLWILTIRKDVNDFPLIDRFFESHRLDYQLIALEYVKTHPNKEFLSSCLKFSDTKDIPLIKSLIQVFHYFDDKKVELNLIKWLDHTSIEVVTLSAWCLYRKGLLHARLLEKSPPLKSLIAYFEKFYA